jgi:hypothetical protein
VNSTANWRWGPGRPAKAAGEVPKVAVTESVLVRFRASAAKAHRRWLSLSTDVTVNSGTRRLMVASLRYLDTFVKMDGVWLFLERLLYVDWVDERVLS